MEVKEGGGGELHFFRHFHFEKVEVWSGVTLCACTQVCYRHFEILKKVEVEKGGGGVLVTF